MEKKRETFDFATDLASLRPKLIRRAEWRWPRRYWKDYSPEDLASETICRALASQEAFRGTFVAELAKYAQVILDNLIYNLHREMQGHYPEPLPPSQQLPPKGGTTPSGKLMKKEDEEKVADALRLLPSDQRCVCELIDMRDQSYEKASAATSKSVHTLYRLIRKARSTLRRLLARQYVSHT